MDGTGSFQRRVVQVERIRVQGSLTYYVCHIVIHAPSCQVTAKDVRFSSPPTCRNRSFPASSKPRARKIEKKKKDENVDSHVGFKFPVKVPRIVGAICRYSWGIHQPRSRWFQDCKVNAIASYEKAGRCAVPIRVVRCAPVIPSVGLDLLSCSFTFVIALADVKKISSTFTMTYSSFPWRRRLFSL